LPEWSDYAGLFAEIQVRTLLQHTWASIEHVLIYKNEADAPHSLRRRLSRLSALFELADEELDHLLRERSAQTVEYTARLHRGERDVPIDVDSLRSYITHSMEVKYWNEVLRTAVMVGVGDGDFGDLSRLVRFADRFNLNFIHELDSLLISAHGWGERFLSQYFAEQFRTGILSSPEKTYVVGSGALNMLMIAANAGDVSAEELQTDFGWGGGATLLDAASKARPS
jgi:putative GTP pyrophosphokinase